MGRATPSPTHHIRCYQNSREKYMDPPYTCEEANRLSETYLGVVSKSNDNVDPLTIGANPKKKPMALTTTTVVRLSRANQHRCWTSALNWILTRHDSVAINHTIYKQFHCCLSIILTKESTRRSRFSRPTRSQA